MAVLNDHMLGDIWQREGGRCNAAMDRPQLAWLGGRDRARAERMRQARMLFEGRHEEYFVGEGRSRFSFTPIKAGEPAFYSPFNVLGLISKKSADLIFGDAPRVYSDDQVLQARIDTIADRSGLNAELLAGAMNGSWAGEAYLEIARIGGEAYVAQVCADEVFPTGAPTPDRQYTSYIRYATADATIPGQAKPVKLLLETQYSAGKIVRRVWRLDVSGGGGATAVNRVEQLGIDLWPSGVGPLPEEENTGLSRPSLVRIPNEHDGASDYDGLIALQDALSAKHTQIARVLAKHADPKLAAPATSADEEGNLRGTAQGAEVYFFRNKDEVPGYITWNAELAAAIEDRKFAINALCMAAEMSQVLLGLKDGAAPDAARKLRLEATNSLAKAQRKAASWRPGIILAVSLAVEAETGGRPAAPLGVEIRDGLPDDELDLAQTISTLRAAGAISLSGAVRMRGLDAAAADKELTEIRQENKDNAPSVFGDAAEKTTAGEGGAA